MSVVLLAILLLGLVMTLPGLTARPWDTNPSDLDGHLRAQIVAHRLPGLAAVITQGDRVLLAQGYGDGVTPRTQFLIASVSKSITALAVLQLVDAGQADLDAPVRSYLPDFTTAKLDEASRITVRHLLNQTSGMSDTGFPESILPQPATIAERVASLGTAELVSTPGGEFHYFNPNYGVLAAIVEAVSGEPFAEYVKRHIFEPLDMRDTFSADTAGEAVAQATALAPGHVILYGIPIALPEMDGFLAGSGGTVSTARDLANFLIMQSSGGMFGGETVASPSSLSQMHTPPHAGHGAYAMGWLTAEYDGVPVVEHNGILSVYYAEVVLLPQTGHGIVLLYNTNGLPATLFAFPQIKQGLIRLLTGGQPASGAISLPVYGLVIGLLTILTAVPVLRSLIRAIGGHIPQSGSVRGIIWSAAGGLVPAGLLVLLTRLMAFSGRVFSTAQLFRFMPDVYLLLGLTGTLGLLNGLVRAYRFARKRRDRTLPMG